MMMQWYLENPRDGIVIARSIKIGLPPEQSEEEAKNDDKVPLGVVIPEADREVSKSPIALAKDNCIPALSLDSSYGGKTDLRYSSPKKLLKQKLMMVNMIDMIAN